MLRLFVVDDHPIVRAGLRALLESVGHAVVGEAHEPAAARRAVAALHPDLVLLDLQLERHSGFELLAELRRLQPPIPSLVLTVSHRAEDVAEARRLGASGYLLKDAPADLLLAAIDTVMQGGTCYSDALGEAAAAAAGGTAALDALSSRERQIISLVANGHSSADIGDRLGLSRKTVDTYRSRLMGKLGVADLAGLVRLAVREGLVDRGR